MPTVVQMIFEIRTWYFHNTAFCELLKDPWTLREKDASKV